MSSWIWLHDPPRPCIKGTVVVILVLLSVFPLNAVAQANYEATIQAGLDALYAEDYASAGTYFGKLSLIRPRFPAPLVYRELLDSWIVAEDPQNSELINRFHHDADAAIAACEEWTARNPSDAEGWRVGLKMHNAALKAYERDPNDPDVLLGLGSYDYFAAKVPLVVRPVAWLFTSAGDRDRGLRRIETTIASGRHLRIEAAMVLASAYWSEGDYQQFHSVLENDIAARYPNLLPVRTWELSGLICDDHLPEAHDLIESVASAAYWKNFQLGRIALAEGSRDEGKRLAFARQAEQLFMKSVQESGPNGSILRWDSEGIRRAQLLGARADAAAAPADRKEDKVGDRLFRPPHGCPH